MKECEDSGSIGPSLTQGFRVQGFGFGFRGKGKGYRVMSLGFMV